MSSPHHWSISPMAPGRPCGISSNSAVIATSQMSAAQGRHAVAFAANEFVNPMPARLPWLADVPDQTDNSAPADLDRATLAGLGVSLADIEAFIVAANALAKTRKRRLSNYRPRY